MPIVSSTTAQPSKPSAFAHPDSPAGACLTADTICELRALDYAAPKVVASLIPHLAQPCHTCWDAVEEARKRSPAKRLPPSEVPEIRLLRTLTVASDEELMPFHRLARAQARNAPLGVFRLMLEEIRRDLVDTPQLAISHVQYLRGLLAEDPEPSSLWEWNALVIDLASTEARGWAECGCQQQSFLLLHQAETHFTYEPHDEEMPGYHLDCGHCLFLSDRSEDAWQASMVLARLQLDPADPRSLEILLEHARRDASVGDLQEAHGNALRVLKGAKEEDVLRLAALHLLTRVEIRLSVEHFLEPPASGLYLHMAMVHFEQAIPLYAEWGRGNMLLELAEHRRFMERESDRWATPEGLRARRQEHIEAGAVVPLFQWALLGMAASIDDTVFIDAHLPGLRQRFRSDRAFQTDLDGFQELVRSLQDLFAEEARKTLFTPWQQMLDEVRG